MTDHTHSSMKAIFDDILTRYTSQIKILLNKVSGKESGSPCEEMELVLQIDSELQNAYKLLVQHQHFQKKLTNVIHFIFF